MHTTMALPSIASRRSSKWRTRSAAMSLIRFSAPTTASSCAHFDRNRCVRDNHDVATIGDDSVAVALLFGEELLNRGEHYAAGGNLELLAQVGPALRLNWLLAQQLMAAREGAEELVIEIVAVGEHDDCGVGHLRMQDHAAGVEGHGETLA